MKKTLNLLLLLWAAILAACSSEEPRPVSAAELYNREFVKEFGVPAIGHDYSMATTAGLKVSTLRGDHVTVSAEIDGEEYLFADCHVPVGTTDLPVTIPCTVTELKITTNHGTRTVATDALVNLDEITAPTIRRAAPQSVDGNPYLAFRRTDFLTYFFNAYPQKISSMSNLREGYLSRSKQGFLFPVYWRKDMNNRDDYVVLFSQSLKGANSGVETTAIKFTDIVDDSTPFPGLRCIPSCKSPQEFTIEDYATSDRFTAYPDDRYTDGDIIISRGINLEDYVNPNKLGDNSYQWYLELVHENGGPICSESVSRNVAYWSGYYDVPLKALNNAYMGTTQFSMATDLWMMDTGLEGGSKLSGINELRSYPKMEATLIGFTTAATKIASTDPRDFCDVIFLFVPTGEHSWGTAGAMSSYFWTIAAEDLGATDDWDFNDAVFNFSDQIKDLNTENIGAMGCNTTSWGPRDAEPVRVITVTPEAAGGTMPLYITYTGKVAKKPEIPTGSRATAEVMYSDANNALRQFTASMSGISEATYVLGKEIHSWLGADSYTTMINTGSKRQYLRPEPVEFAIPRNTQLGVGYNPASGSYEHGSLMASSANKTLCGFAVVVDKNNTLGIDAMNDTDKGLHRADNLIMGNDMYVIGKPDASNGEIAPQMILVTGGFYWPQERVKISDAYPDFASWLRDPASAANWDRNRNKDKITY